MTAQLNRALKEMDINAPAFKPAAKEHITRTELSESNSTNKNPREEKRGNNNGSNNSGKNRPNSQGGQNRNDNRQGNDSGSASGQNNRRARGQKPNNARGGSAHRQQQQGPPKDRAEVTPPKSENEAPTNGRPGHNKPHTDMRQANGENNNNSENNQPQQKNEKNTNRNKNKNKNRKKKKNTENFEPCFDPPDMRVVAAPASRKNYGRQQTVHDVIVVPELFCAEDDMSVYDGLLAELKSTGRDDLFVAWHGDSHVIANDRTMGGKWKKLSPTFQKVIDRMQEYFNMRVEATRLNWYRDSKEWKPYHHDRAALIENCPQNITVAASFGSCRDVSFQHVKSMVTTSMPQPNGTCYTFGRDVNIEWKHGVLQVPPEKQHSEGRISIIAWGWTDQEKDDGTHC